MITQTDIDDCCAAEEAHKVNTLEAYAKEFRFKRAKLYVNMVDRFMSGWGCASGGRSILIVACETLAQADAIERAARDRDEMRYISVTTKPRRVHSSDHVSHREFDEMGGAWRAYYREF